MKSKVTRTVIPYREMEGEMTQLLKCLPCKYESQSLDPQHPHKQLGSAVSERL